MTDEQIIREYFEADAEYRKALATEIAKPELATLPQDVREARAHLACIEQSERLIEARAVAEARKADREERWIAAHEDLIPFRSAGRAS